MKVGIGIERRVHCQFTVCLSNQISSFARALPFTIQVQKILSVCLQTKLNQSSSLGKNGKYLNDSYVQARFQRLRRKGMSGRGACTNLNENFENDLKR